MPEPQQCLEYLSFALVVGLQAAIPVLAAVVIAGLLASFLQTMIGYGDISIGAGFRVAGVAISLVVAGGWISGLVLTCWHWAWQMAGKVLGGGP